MGQRLTQARHFDALASEAKTLAEAQALSARADQLRRGARGWLAPWAAPFIRN
jgi:hypothetical protein